jgi:hypothetical protein
MAYKRENFISLFLGAEIVSKGWIYTTMKTKAPLAVKHSNKHKFLPLHFPKPMGILIQHFQIGIQAMKERVCGKENEALVFKRGASGRLSAENFVKKQDEAINVTN